MIEENKLDVAAFSVTQPLVEIYEWNDANRLIRHTNSLGDVTTYRYDGDHNRVFTGTSLASQDAANNYPAGHPLGNRIGWEPQYKKEQTAIYFANDTTMTYVEPLMAISEDRTWKQNYTYGAYGERISMSYVPSGDTSNAWEPTPGASGANSGNTLTTLYYLSDVRGSVVRLMDPEGAIAVRYHYDEFGSVMHDEKFDLNHPGPDNLFGYTGLGYDYTSGLNHARARYFDVSIGRFISEDTYEGDLNDPQSLNLYTYVHNNPLRYVDPTGNAPCYSAEQCRLLDEKLGLTKNKEEQSTTSTKRLDEMSYDEIMNLLFSDGVSHDDKARIMAYIGVHYILGGGLIGETKAVTSATKAANVAKGTGEVVGNFVGKLNTKNIPNMSKKEILDSLPKDWKVDENNGFVHIRDASGNVRMKIDPPDKVTKYDHVHLFDESGNPIDVNLNVVDRKSPDAHIPYKK